MCVSWLHVYSGHHGIKHEFTNIATPEDDGHIEDFHSILEREFLRRNDYYSFDAVKHRLVGERGGHVYRLGDKMTVLVARVDLDERKIDFEPAGEEISDD